MIELNYHVLSVLQWENNDFSLLAYVFKQVWSPFVPFFQTTFHSAIRSIGLADTPSHLTPSFTLSSVFFNSQLSSTFQYPICSYAINILNYDFS